MKNRKNKELKSEWQPGTWRIRYILRLLLWFFPLAGGTTLLSCNAPDGLASFGLTPEDTVKKVFDIEKFNRYKSAHAGLEQYEIIEEGRRIKMSRQPAYYTETIHYPDSLFGDYNRYYFSGRMMSKGRFFVKGDFRIGKVIYFDETGQVERVEDLEAPYVFSVEDMLDFMEKENISIRAGDTRLWREQAGENDLDGIREGSYIWVIWYRSAQGEARHFILDAKTGAVLLDEPLKWGLPGGN